MKAPRLIADYENGEGTVKFPRDWRELSSLTRADILRDWVFELAAEYNDAVDEMNNPHSLGNIAVSQTKGTPTSG